MEGHAGSKWQHRDPNSDRLVPGSVLLITTGSAHSRENKRPSFLKIVPSLKKVIRLLKLKL